MPNINLEAGKKYKTRDGRIVEVLGVSSRTGVAYPAVGFITSGDGSYPMSWRLDGRGNSYETTDHDLVAEHVEPFEAWVVVATRENGHQDVLDTAGLGEGGGEIAARQSAASNNNGGGLRGSTYRAVLMREVTEPQS